MLLQLFGCTLVLFVAAFYLLRLLARLRSLRGHRVGFFPSYTSMGNALQQLQAMAEPEVQHILQEKQRQEADEDDEGDPDDPAAHLEKQLRRIRNGEEIDRLTIRLGP